MSNVLIVARKVRKLSAGQVASEIGITLLEYEKLESGESKITVETAQRLGSFFEVEMEYFLKEEGMVINHNSGTSSKGIVNTKSYNENRDSEFSKEIFNKLIEEKDNQISLLKKELETLKNE